MASTPSERQHLKINPYPLNSGYQPRNPLLLILKNIFGSPVPLFLTLYSASLLVSMSGMEIFGWGFGLLTLIYIIIDRFSSQKELQFRFIGADIWIWLLVAYSSLGLLINAPEADFWKHFGKLRWAVLLYLLVYAHLLFPGLKKYFRTLFILGFAVGVYSVIQHFTGWDLRYDLGLRAESAVDDTPGGDGSRFQVVGLFGHHLTYGYVFSMLLCFTLAGVALLRHYSLLIRGALAITSLIFGMSLIWTYGRGVWIATVAAIIFMAGFMSRKLLIVTGLVLAIGTTGLYLGNSNFQKRVDSIFDSNYRSNSVRDSLWRANFEMIKDHPWVGVGINQNEALSLEYQKKLNVEGRLMKGHAHNTYIQWLATTGVPGFLFYMAFILSYLLMTCRLWSIVPYNNSFHRMIVLGALGAQISLHVGGLTQWSFGDAEVNHFFIFILAMVSYLHLRYDQSTMPDDDSL